MNDPDPAAPPSDVRFRALPRFNEPALQGLARARGRVSADAIEAFPGDHLRARFARALCERRAVSLKELLESFELHERVRRRLRRPVVADLCCGHGLTGVLFALLERSVERVVLVDAARPASFGAILDAAIAVGPHVADKLTYVEAPLEDAPLPEGAAVLGVHACGERTDACLERALALGGPAAVMPCCYHLAPRAGPPALHEALGRALSIDVHRTYRLEAAGFAVSWAAIPRAITPMNRILLALPPG